MKATAKARVTATLTIEIGDTWGEDFALRQVMRQAKDSARTTLRHVLVPDGVLSDEALKRARKAVTVDADSMRVEVLVTEEPTR